MSCCKKRLIITEDEKIDILSQYGIIIEQEVKTAKIMGNSFFGDGKWRELNPNAKKELDKQIEQAIDFLSKNKGQVGSIQITASESQVPNSDQEPGTDFGKPLKVLELSRRRAETMKKYLESKFKDALQNKIINKLPEFTEPKLLRGQTPYDSKNRNNPQYERERYVLVDVSLQAITNPLECLDNMIIKVFYEKGKHACDSAVFRLSINGNVLTSTLDVTYATLNNQALFNKVSSEEQEKTRKNRVELPLNRVDLTDGKAGGVRRNVFVINSELAKKLLQPGQDGKVPTEFKLEVQCLNNEDVGGTFNDDPNFGVGCHGDALSIQFINGKKDVQPTLNYNPPQQRGQTIVYATIDACGNEIKK